MERYKFRVVAAGMAGVAIALGVADEAGARGLAGAVVESDAAVHFVYAEPAGPELAADLVVKGKALVLGRKLAPRMAGPVVAVRPGRATLTAAGGAAVRAGGLHLKQAVNLAPGRRYCLGIVKPGRAHTLIVQDVTSQSRDAGDLPRVCEQFFARWIP